MLEVEPHLLEFGLGLRQRSLFLVTSRTLILLFKERHAHLDASHIVLHGNRRCLVILGHLNNIELLLSDTDHPELPVDVAKAGLEVMPGRPRLRVVAERAHNTESI